MLPEFKILFLIHLLMMAILNLLM